VVYVTHWALVEVASRSYLNVVSQGLPQSPSSLKRIVVLNPKGGSGKTTLAVNIAGYMAWRGHRTALMDRDPQGSSTRWVRKRKPSQPAIHGISAFERDSRTTRAWQMRVPDGTERLIIDTPAAVDAHSLPDLVRDAYKVIVPVLPSDIDLHACSRCIADLLLVAKIRREENKIGVVANRVRKNTLVYQSLMKFLQSLRIPIVATIRDSQNYVRSAELGVSIHEMKSYVVKDDMIQWQSLVGWLDGVQTPASIFEQSATPPQTTLLMPTSAPVPAAANASQAVDEIDDDNIVAFPAAAS
jgi:chromosome partitioning protein